MRNSYVFKEPLLTCKGSKSAVCLKNIEACAEADKTKPQMIWVFSCSIPQLEEVSLRSATVLKGCCLRC